LVTRGGKKRNKLKMYAKDLPKTAKNWLKQLKVESLTRPLLGGGKKGGRERVGRGNGTAG